MRINFFKINKISLFITFLSVFLLLSFSLSAAVYKHVDAQGNVTYADTPQKKGDKPISMPEPTTFKATKTPAPKSSTTETRRATKPKKPSAKYDSVSITAPKNDQAFRSNSGEVSFTFSASPALQSNHHYVLFLNGTKVKEGTSASVTLTNLDRGTHSVAVEIQDDTAQTLVRSGPVTFHLLRQSAIRR